MSEYFVGSTGANNQTTFESLSTSEVLDDLQLNTTHSPTFNGLTVGNHVLPNADSTIDLGTNSTRFANVYADTLYGDGSNLTNLPSGADNTKLPLAGGTMSGAIAMGSQNITGGGSFFANLFSVGNEGKVVSTSSLGLQLQATGSQKPITFSTNDGGITERMRVHTDGNVGIGTGATAPADKLTIQEDSADFSIRKTDGTLSARIVQFGSGASELRQYDASGSQKVSINTVGDSYFNGGNVGIGATIPSSLLHINAADGIMVDTFTAYIRNQEATAGDNFGLGIQAGSNSSDVSLQVSDKAGTSLLRVRGDGNVGIGTTSPASLLHISSSTSGDAVLTIEADTDNNDENDNPYIHFKQDGGGVTAKVGIEGTNGLTFTNSLGNHAYLGSEQNHGVQLYANGAAGLTLRGGGDIGIGTNAPETKLHVYKSSATSGTSTGTSVLRLQNYVGSDLSQQKVFADFVLADDNANEIPQVRIGAEVGQNGDADSQVKEGSGAFVVYTNNADTTSGDAGASLAERMRVDYQGNVGIGTTSPSFKLDVNGTANIATHLVTPLIYSGGGNIVFGNVAQFNANVGIGTTNPAQKLHVNGNVDIDNGGILLQRGYGINLGLSGYDIWMPTTTRVGIQTAATERLSILNNGNVGIGTTSPSTTLDVNGITTSKTFRTNTSNTDYNVISRNSTSTTLWVQAAQSGSIQGIASFRYGSATVNQGTEVCVIRRNSSYFINTKLGVGTNNPATTLDVEGTIKHKVYTVSTLPSASPAGQRAFVSDSYYNLQQSHGSGVSGGGSNFCPVYSDGSNWFNG